MRNLRDSGFTLGFISHRLDEALAISDRLTVLRDGKIVMRETRDQFAATWPSFLPWWAGRS